MPSCIVPGCNSRKNRETALQGVILHCFPGKLENIKQWLMQTGQPFQNIEALAQRVLAGKKNDVFRLCSKHFEPECYIYKSEKKIKHLKDNAIPTIFPHQETLPPPEKRQCLELEHNYCLSNESVVVTFPSSTSIIPPVTTTSTRPKNNSSTLAKKHVKIGVNRNDFQKNASTNTPYQYRRSTGTNTSLKRKRDTGCNTEIFTVDRGCQFPEEEQFLSSTSIIQLDHFYPSKFSTPRATRRPSCKEPSEQSCNSSFLSSPEKDDNNDPDYKPENGSFSPQNLSTSFIADLQDEDFIRERKFIVFETALDRIVNQCVCVCGEKIENLEKKIRGTYLSLHGTCIIGHDFFWESQPTVHRIPLGNVLVAASILFNGGNYSKIYDMCSSIGIQFISSSSYFRYQRQFLFPVVDFHWKQQKKQILGELKDQPVCLIGDGQCDSPGHNAKYCVYTLMDAKSYKIVDFETVQVTQTTSSVAMEKLAFQNCLERILDDGMDVHVLATDRHVGIRKVMREQYPDIAHEFDVWHYAKSIQKKLLAASKKRSCSQVADWISPIRNHFWYSCGTARGNVELLRERWLSLLYHIQNIHEFEGKLVQKCDHRTLQSDEVQKHSWMSSSTSAYEQIEKIVTDKQLIKDLQHLVRYSHTGQLEVFHSFLLKYRTKRIHYSIDGMEARTKLAILAHNCNLNRPQATVKKLTRKSAPVGTYKHNLIFSKLNKKWMVKKVYTPMSFKHLFPMFVNVIQILKNELEHSWRSRTFTVPRNISVEPRPMKTDAVAAHKSRFS